jgi:2-polyprenyl-3-methyl-5-hydroxy-6-metoxy-1,4-benzoquinol methylase
MEKKSYVKYMQESKGWLHKGRSALIEKILTFYVNKQNNDLSILEVGAGVGQNIPMLSRFGIVDALEMDALGLDELRKRDDIREIIDAGIPCHLKKKYDIICAFDVIEHIENDKKALDWVANNLKENGIFIATVPAYQWFFSQHDRALGHYRRYNLKDLEKILPEDMQYLSSSYFNTFLFPFAVLSRGGYILKNFFSKGSNGKQSVINDGLFSQILLWVFLKEIQSTKISTRRLFGLSCYICCRKKNNESYKD